VIQESAYVALYGDISGGLLTEIHEGATQAALKGHEVSPPLSSDEGATEGALRALRAELSGTWG
jgi:hypothetical protein